MTLENEGSIEDEIDETVKEIVQREDRFEHKLISEILRCIHDDLIHYTSEEIQQYRGDNEIDASLLHRIFRLEGIRIDMYPTGWKMLYLRHEPIFSWIIKYGGTKFEEEETVVEYHRCLRSYDDRLNHLQNNPPEI